MITLYFDCSMGAAGDMLTGALLELYPDPAAAVAELNRIFSGYTVITAKPDNKCGIQGTHVTVQTVAGVEGETAEDHSESVHEEHHHHHHTSLQEVRSFISRLNLPESVIADSLSVYDEIARAESTVHGMEMENIHFHEVGSLDAMADVVSVCWLIHELHPDEILSSAINTGSGTVHCAHGILPVPAPATLHILQGVPAYCGGEKGELCTPTGAALLKHFCTRFENMPQLCVKKIGYGTGTKDFGHANVVRAVLGESGSKNEKILELSCNLDDMTPEEIGYVQERLFQVGALDVYVTNIGMKKSRPGFLLTCMCREMQREKMLQVLFAETTTLGVREYICNRYTMEREITTVETAFGPVRMKQANGWGTTRSKAEYEDLKRIAEEKELPLRVIKENILKQTENL